VQAMQTTNCSKSRAHGLPSHGGQYNDKRDTLANLAHMAGHDISQTASLPSIAAGSNYTEARQAYIMVLISVIVVLVAVFSDLAKSDTSDTQSLQKIWRAMSMKNRRSTRRGVPKWRAEVSSKPPLTRPLLTVFSQPH
jgi:hypothetical protein